MDNKIDAHLGRRLRSRRQLLGLTQGQIGGAIGVRAQQIQRYECGANKMSAVTLWKLAQALDVSLDYFFDDLK
jgi:transcriptional regulator with XRE-family HTH domain